MITSTVLLGIIGDGGGVGHTGRYGFKEPPDPLPPGCTVAFYRGQAGMRAILDRFARLPKQFERSTTKSIEAALKKPDTMLLVTPQDEAHALAWLRANVRELERLRRAPTVLFLAAGGAAHRKLARLIAGAARPRARPQIRSRRI
jgi:hypothetical protein